MSTRITSRRLARTIACGLIGLILVEISPVPVLAAEEAAPSPEASSPAPTPEAPTPSPTVAASVISKDLDTLKRMGKEAFLDGLFQRVDHDSARIKSRISAIGKSFGESKLVQIVKEAKSAVLSGEVEGREVQGPRITFADKINRFVDKAVRAMKDRLSAVPEQQLGDALGATYKLAKAKETADKTGDSTSMVVWYSENWGKVYGHSSSASTKGIAPEIRAEGGGWFERVFGNSNLIRNLCVSIVGLTSLGIAAYLAIVTTSVTGLVAVLGALVSLIALLRP